MRLAKFNIDDRQHDSFIGVPTPAVALFFISFPLETDFFFANFEWNPECTTESNQMNSSNTVSIQGLRPDVADLKFEDLVNAKPDLAVFRLSDGTVSENLG